MGAMSRLRRRVVSDRRFFVTCRGRACCWNASKLARMAVTQPLLAVPEERHSGVAQRGLRSQPNGSMLLWAIYM
jgi:hypothetical protein